MEALAERNASKEADFLCPFSVNFPLATPSLIVPYGTFCICCLFMLFTASSPLLEGQLRGNRAF